MAVLGDGSGAMTLRKKPEYRTTVRMPEDVRYAAKAAASVRNEPLQEFVAEAVRIRVRSLGMGNLLKAHATKKALGT